MTRYIDPIKTQGLRLLWRAMQYPCSGEAYTHPPPTRLAHGCDKWSGFMSRAHSVHAIHAALTIGYSVVQGHLPR